MLEPKIYYTEKSEFYLDDIISGLFEDEALFLEERFLEFKECKFDNMIFAESKMVKSDLSNVIFEKCDLSNVDFTDSSIHRVVFKNCKMTGVNMADCNLKYVQIINSKCDYLNLSFSKLEEEIGRASCRERV